MQHRSAERHQVQKPATIRPIRESDGKESLQVTIRDISTGGALLHLDQSLATASLWDLSITEAQDVGGVLAIRWCAPHSDGGFAVGGQFVQGRFMLSALGIDDTESDSRDHSAPQVLAIGELAVTSLTNASVEAWRSVRVERSVRRCTLDVNDALIVGEAIVGGVTYCGSGITADRVGSEQGVPTVLHLGRAQSLAVMLEQADEFLPVIERRIQQVQDELDQMAANAGRNHQEREQELILTMQRDEMIARRDRVQSNRVNLAMWPETKWTARLEVRSVVHAGTAIYFGTERFDITEDLTGPVLISTDDEGVPVLEQSGKKTPLRDRLDPPAEAA